MKRVLLLAGASLIVAASVPPAAAEERPAPPPISIDVPVVLQEARVVFNLDHLAFDGDQPIGLQFAKVMVDGFRAAGTNWRIVAIFHGPNGYMGLGDAAYDRVRHWTGGNPYKGQIAALIEAGVEVEICAETMRLNGWGNADLLPRLKVNTGANFRLVELVRQGFVEIQP